MTSPTRPASPALPPKTTDEHEPRPRSASSFRSTSPPSTRPVHIDHPLPNHPHLHIHTIRSPTSKPPPSSALSPPSITSPANDDESAIYDDDLSPPSSISAQVLAPFLNAPVFKALQQPAQNSSNGHGHHSRGATARASALGAVSRSSSMSRGRSRRRMSNEDNSLTAEFLDLLGDGTNLSPPVRERIRVLANERGIPSQLRKFVWPVLLSEWLTEDACPAEDVDCSEMEEKLRKIAKRIRGELSRYHRRKNKRALPSSSVVTPSTTAFSSTTPEPSVGSTASSTTSTPSNSPPHSLFLDDAPLDLAVESTVISFLTANPEIEYSPGMVYLAYTLGSYIYSPTPLTPPIHGFDDPNLLLRQSFHAALSLFGQLPLQNPLIRTPSTRQNSTVSLLSVLPSTEASKFPATHRISQFLSAFRLVMPELASYFDDEGVGGWGDDWVGGWVGWFCAKELCGKINDEVKARLWDHYFSFPPLPASPQAEPNGPGEDLHIYVCIALLKSCADALEVLEQSEIRTLLQQLPPVEDVEGILREARRIREKVLLVERQEEEAGYLARKASGGSRSGSEKSA